jgi:RHS repeat-associated protein
MGIMRMVCGLARARRVGVAGLVGVVALVVPAVVLATGATRTARPEALRTMPVRMLHSGRVLSRRARLFVPAAARAAALPAGREIPRLRTVTSDTFSAGLGVFSTRIYPFAVNFRDRAGRLVPIDDQLVGDGRGGYRNRAGSFRVDLPASGSGRAVRFSTGRAWVSLALQGARGVGQVAGNHERFAGALPGVVASYTVGTMGLDAQLRLFGRSAPTSFTYSIHTSRGLSPHPGAGGMITLTNAGGGVAFAVAPARMWSTGAPAAVERVRSSLHAVPGGWRLTLTPDARFVARVLRAGGSVVVDPAVFPGTVVTLPNGHGSTGDCELAAQTPTTAVCGNAVDYVANSGSVNDHTVWQFDVADNVPRNAEVLSTELGASIVSNQATAASQVGLYQVTHSWTQSATWNTYDGTNPWSAPGGDTTSSPADTASISTTAKSAYWHPLSLVQGWVDGTIANDGLMLKTVGSSTLAQIGFDSTFASSNRPYLNIRYEQRLGDYRGYTLDSQKLTDRSSLGVNVADGNLLTSNKDVHVAGTAGADLVIGRYYNNLDSIQGAFGRGWTMSPGADTALDIAGNGLFVFYRGASGAVKTFSKSGSTWTSPPGLDAVLTQNSSTTWSLHFNQSGLTQHFTGPGGNNTAALLTSVVDRNGNTISYAYNASNQLQTITDSQGRQSTVQYNTAGYVSQITDSLGRVYKYYQDTSGNLTSYVDPANHTTTYAYDGHGDLTKITTAQGNITKFAYAGASSGDYRVTSVTRLVKPTDSTGPTRAYAYYTGGSPCATSDEGRTVETNELGYSTTYCYNASDQVDTSVDPDGHTTSKSFTADGNVAQLTTPTGGTAVLGYQNPGTSSERVTSIQLGGSSGPQATLVYSDPNNAYAPSQVTDPQNRSVSYAYDSAGNEHTATDQLASQNQATLDHNANGTVSDSIDADGNTTTYHYTSGNLTEIDPPDLTHLGKTTITYDTLSRPKTIIDGKGQERDYSYDAFDRVSGVTYKNASGTTVATIGYTYDNDGNLIKRTESAGTSSYGYDGLNRLTSETFPDSSTHSYSYDAASNLKTITDAGGTTTYGYNKENWLTSVADSAGTTTLGYDNDGNRTSISYPNGASSAYTYASDHTGRLTNVLNTYNNSAGAPVTLNYAYTYTDSSGRDTMLRQTMTQGGTGGSYTFTNTYTYDALNRLTEAVLTNVGYGTLADTHYTMDGNGNMLQEADLQLQWGFGSTYSYAYNADNQICWTYLGSATGSCASPPSGAYLPTYDLNGNLTSDGNGLTLTYNALDQTSSINGATNSYYGEGQNERIIAGPSSYQNDILGLSRRDNGSGDIIYLTRDLNGQIVDQRGSSSGTYYPLFDGEGTIVGLTDTKGQLLDGGNFTYDPYGNRDSAGGGDPNSWGFQGGYITAGNLYHFGARYYNPLLPAWTQQDPIDNPSSLLQADRYVFVGDDPINLADVVGRSFTGVAQACVKGAATGTAVGIVTSGGTASAVDAGIGCATGSVIYDVGQVNEAVGQLSEIGSSLNDIYNEFSSLL